MIRCVRVSMTSTTLAVEAETSSRRPSGDSAMWSARLPSTGTRQAIFLVCRSIATTSAKLGREKYTSRPSRDVKPSSTYWLWPSPTSARIASKYSFLGGSAVISAIRSSLSGITSIRASRLNVCGSTRSAVPAQLLLITITSRCPAGAAGAAIGAPSAPARAAPNANHQRCLMSPPPLSAGAPPPSPSAFPRRPRLKSPFTRRSPRPACRVRPKPADGRPLPPLGGAAADVGTQFPASAEASAPGLRAAAGSARRSRGNRSAQPWPTGSAGRSPLRPGSYRWRSLRWTPAETGWGPSGGPSASCAEAAPQAAPALGASWRASRLRCGRARVDPPRAGCGSLRTRRG